MLDVISGVTIATREEKLGGVGVLCGELEVCSDSLLNAHRLCDRAALRL